MRRSDTGRDGEMNGHLDSTDEKGELRQAEEPASPVLPAGDEDFPITRIYPPQYLDRSS